MNTSEKVDQVFASLCAAQAELKNPPHDSTNPHFKSRFASLASHINTITPVLQRHGLCVSQLIEGEGDIVGVTTLLGHKSGQFISSTAKVKLPKTSGQDAGAMITYLRRYGLASIVGVVGDQDDDGESNRVSHDARKVDAPPARQSAPPAPSPAPAPRAAPSADAPKGTWRMAKVHFGKHKDRPLGELEGKSIQWFFHEWMPKKRVDEKYKPREADLALFKALEEWHEEIEARKGDGSEFLDADAPEDNSEIPF